jgi:glycosyltransferase involved in cell wall biosynthesis
MANVVYISLTGMTEPLGESQVVQYLLELVKNNSIFLLSFEKPTRAEKYNRMRAILNKADIKWHFFKYSNRFGIFSTGFQIIQAFILLIKLIKKNDIQVIHARSLIPAIIGLLLAKICNVKLLFDIRGFAIEEKIVDGRLKPRSMLTWLLKKVESTVYKMADHVVSLTHSSRPILEKQYQVHSDNLTVIPTCANAELFKVFSSDEKAVLRVTSGFSASDFIILHNGSLNYWVDFEAEIKLFEELHKLNSDIKFIFLNKGQHDLIEMYLEKSTLNRNHCSIVSADFNEVVQYLNISDLCVFFVKPSFAKQASAPTKFAEMVACHLSSVTNTQYGDMEYYINTYKVGLLLNLIDLHQNPAQAAYKVINYIAEYQQAKPSIQQHFSDLFTEHFSKQIAVARYQEIYNKLVKALNESVAVYKVDA